MEYLDKLDYVIWLPLLLWVALYFWFWRFSYPLFMHKMVKKGQRWAYVSGSSAEIHSRKAKLRLLNFAFSLVASVALSVSVCWLFRRFSVCEPVYGFVAKGFAEGSLLLTNMVLYFSIGLFVLADLTKFFEFFHNYAMRKMAKDEQDISATLSVGQAIDHLMAITLSPLFGIMWAHLGPQSVFWTCAAFSVVQFLIAPRLPESDPAKTAQKA